MDIWVENVIKKSSVDGESLFSGKGAELLIRYLLSKKNPLKQSKAHQIINEIVHQISNDTEIQFTFYNGITGTIWLFNYLQHKKIIELDTAFFEDIDSLLIEACMLQLKLNNYDFLHGALGNLYTIIDRKTNKDSIIKLIHQLSKMQVQFQGVKTFQYQLEKSEKFKQNFTVSLGLSHGIPSIMIVLSKCYRLNYCNEICLEIIKHQYQFLKQNKNHKISKINYSYYPCFVEDKKENIYQSRMAWCYGDMGIAAALYITGKNINNEEMVLESLQIINHYATLKNSPQSGIGDANICHGSSGIAMIFYCFYWNTKNINYLHAAKYWCKISVELLNSTIEINDHLLNGTFGIIGVHQTIIERKKPDWASLFLVF